MPFVPEENRKKIKETGAWETVGDLCYIKYLPIIQAWRKNRRWTQAHNTTKETFGLNDEQAARLLAWFVYMAFEVLPYEIEKKSENGDVA